MTHTQEKRAMRSDSECVQIFNLADKDFQAPVINTFKEFKGKHNNDSIEIIF